MLGMFYWVEKVETYSVGGWNFLDNRHEFVDGGFLDWSYIGGGSVIVSHGCHNPVSLVILAAPHGYPGSFLSDLLCQHSRNMLHYLALRGRNGWRRREENSNFIKSYEYVQTLT